MPLLLKILGIKVVGTAISLIVLLTKTGPSFAPIIITFDQDSIVMETSLKKAFTRGLDEIIMSGTEVGIFFTYTLLERDKEGFITPLEEKTIYQYITYDPPRDSFWVKVVHHYRIPGADLDRAKHAIISIHTPILLTGGIVPDYDYAIKVVAALNAIEIEAIEADNFDLNAFWNFKYPSAITEWIPGKELREP